MVLRALHASLASLDEGCLSQGYELRQDSCLELREIPRDIRHQHSQQLGEKSGWLRGI